MNTHDELRSKPDYESDPVEQLAFELAFELEDADLSPNDYVTVNREKLRAIARRILERLSRERGTVPEGWQDISTAPKDGSKILAWDGDYVIVKANPDGGWSDDFQQYLRLDKWMPLPAPPAVKEGEGV